MAAHGSHRSVDSDERVRLVHHHKNGHSFVTETMLASEAMAYMPILRAVPRGGDRLEASCGTIQIRSA